MNVMGQFCFYQGKCTYSSNPVNCHSEVIVGYRCTASLNWPHGFTAKQIRILVCKLTVQKKQKTKKTNKKKNVWKRGRGKGHSLTWTKGVCASDRVRF